MVEETDNPEKNERPRDSAHRESRKKRKHKHPRPVLLTVICIFAFVFYGLISLVFFVSLFYSGWISEVRNKYLPEGAVSKQMIILITTGGFLLHLISFIGSINIWYRRKFGYIMLSVSTLLIALFQLFSDRISVFTTAVYLCFIIVFGIYYRRFH